MIAGEVNQAIRALRDNGTEAASLHNHSPSDGRASSTCTFRFSAACCMVSPYFC